MKGNEEKTPLFLGNPEFNKKIAIYYAWIPPIVFVFLFGLFVYDGAFITGAIFLILALFLLPLNKYKEKLPKLARAFIIIGLIVLAFYSMNLYI